MSLINDHALTIQNTFILRVS